MEKDKNKGRKTEPESEEKQTNLVERKNATKLFPRHLVRLSELSPVGLREAHCGNKVEWVTAAIFNTPCGSSLPGSSLLCSAQHCARPRTSGLLGDCREGTGGETAATWREQTHRPERPAPPCLPRTQGFRRGGPRQDCWERLWKELLRKGCLEVFPLFKSPFGQKRIMWACYSILEMLL